MKSYEEVTKRYGVKISGFTQDDLTPSPGEEEADLGEIMKQILVESSPGRMVPAFGNAIHRYLGISSSDAISRSSVHECADVSMRSDAAENMEEQKEKAKLVRGASAHDVSGNRELVLFIFS